MQHTIDRRCLSHKPLERIISEDNKMGVMVPPEDDFFPDYDHMAGFRDEAKRCGLKYEGISEDKIFYSVDKEPEMNISFFERCFAYTIIAVAQSIATIRDAQKFIEKSQNTIEKADSAIPGLYELINNFYK
jgi:hypothetical protein